MNHKIEKNTVRETLIIPLYARKMCSGLYAGLPRPERPTVSRFFRFPAGVGDGMMNMQIVKIGFEQTI